MIRQNHRRGQNSKRENVHMGCTVFLASQGYLHRHPIYRQRMLKNLRDQVPAWRLLMLNPFLAGNSNFSSENSHFYSSFP